MNKQTAELLIKNAEEILTTSKLIIGVTDDNSFMFVYVPDAKEFLKSQGITLDSLKPDTAKGPEQQPEPKKYILKNGKGKWYIRAQSHGKAIIESVEFPGKVITASLSDLVEYEPEPVPKFAIVEHINVWVVINHHGHEVASFDKLLGAKQAEKYAKLLVADLTK